VRRHGQEGIQAVFTERKRPHGAMALVLFDVLQLHGKSIMREAWRDRRKRLEDLFDGRQLQRVGIVPITDDAARLYETWVGMGGEGIVLKDPTSLYRPGERSPAWLKLKPKLTLEVVVTGGSAAKIAWGDWGEAVMLELAYEHPRSGEPVHIRQAVRVARDQPFALEIGPRAELVYWGVMPSGMLRHPLFVRWSSDRPKLRTTRAVHPVWYRPAGFRRSCSAVLSSSSRFAEHGIKRHHPSRSGIGIGTNSCTMPSSRTRGAKSRQRRSGTPSS